MNVTFKGCGNLTYNEYLNQLVDQGKVSLRGLKPDAKVFDEMILDVNTEYFEQNGGYEYACRFYEEAYRFAKQLYGKENIVSAVMHADELNTAMTEKYGKPVYHYHLHVMALPWSIRKSDGRSAAKPRRRSLYITSSWRLLTCTKIENNIKINRICMTIKSCRCGPKCNRAKPS